MVDETRAVYADLAARAKFADEGESIKDTRSHLADAVQAADRSPAVDDHHVRTARSASKLAAADASGFVEVG